MKQPFQKLDNRQGRSVVSERRPITVNLKIHPDFLPEAHYRPKYRDGQAEPSSHAELRTQKLEFMEAKVAKV